ncbi:carboxylesterase 4A-like [Anopheles stephensi]|uniref:carboxylesterase 4A-like n=1 Tax=Anopheles stephensi TaxID=30069 RepID=UPI001658BF51|nr:carboxylesterase 4A-like [Anopheles stephensi]XP_035918250.1 carboxylesterase 4A-like [Anopheles stephensi]
MSARQAAFVTFVSILTLASLGTVSAQNDPSRPIIDSPAGQLQGTTESCGLFCSYYAFKGVPYAEPPVGSLRFRNPVPRASWPGVRDASSHGAECLQLSIIPGQLRGSEDCLYLNIYTQQLIGTRPVMVWIHGGGYNANSGNSDEFGPEKLVQENVLLVTLNYRLGVLGFLSTGDRYAAGNWGLKDCLQALRWVRANIRAFGGDPDNVTIFGNSAGAALVHLLTLVDASQGLFHKAIAQSSTALVPYAFQPRPRFYADRIASALGFGTDSTTYVEQLRTVPAEQFVPFQQAGLTVPVPRFLRPSDFGPVVEPSDAPEEILIRQRPIELIRNGAHRVPLIVGYNDLEGAFFTAFENAIDPTVKGQFNANPHLLVPMFWNVGEGTAASGQISGAFRNHYWQSRPLDASLDYEWTVYQSDHLFLFAIDQTVRFHAQSSTVPMYYYQFSYDGDLNLYKKLFGVQHPGAIHTDELPYLFHIPSAMLVPVSPDSHANTVSSRLVRMWTNFARTGNPTPTQDPLLQNVQWPSMGATGTGYLSIGHDLMLAQQTPNPTRMNLWYDLQRTYANAPFEL